MTDQNCSPDQIGDEAEEAVYVRVGAVGEPIYQVWNGDRLAWLDASPEYYWKRVSTLRCIVYTAPPARKVMTDKWAFEILKSVDPDAKRLPPGFKAFWRAIVADLALDTEVAKDAKRYRWLRQYFDTIYACDDDGKLIVSMSGLLDGRAEKLDAAIDFATENQPCSK